MTRIKTIDAEVAGEAVRLIVEGAPSVPGRTMAQKQNWLRKHGDGVRRLLMLEPRGHSGMHGAMLTEPVSPASHAGVLSMHAQGFPIVSGESIIAAATIALEHGLIEGVDGELLIDTPAGLFRARPAEESDIPDPYQRGTAAYAIMAREIEKALLVVGPALRPPAG